MINPTNSHLVTPTSPSLSLKSSEAVAELRRIQCVSAFRHTSTGARRPRPGYRPQRHPRDADLHHTLYCHSLILLHEGLGIKSCAVFTAQPPQCSKRDSNPHSCNSQRILSPSCLPFHHSSSLLVTAKIKFFYLLCKSFSSGYLLFIVFSTNRLRCSKASSSSINSCGISAPLAVRGSKPAITVLAMHFTSPVVGL